MKQAARKPTLGKRFLTWLLSIVAGFILKRIAKRVGISTQKSSASSKKRKYVKNEAE